MSIREKMISMVDFDSFVEALKVTMNSEKANEKLNLDHVRRYLDEWAKAKEDIFVLFGERLIVSKPVEFALTRDEMDSYRDELYREFPKYAATISMIDINDFLANKLTDDTTCGFLGKTMPSIFKNGAKVSRALSQLFKDGEFDIALSKYLQNRQVSGLASVSIHPLDYITISTNTHSWGSCMCILKGFNKTGGHSLMLDRNTVVASQYRDKMTTYENVGGSFQWNDKIFRQLFIFDDSMKSFVSGHYNGTVDRNVRKVWINTLKEMFPKDTNWKDNPGCYGYASKQGKFYYDTSYEGKYSVSNGDKDQPYPMGVKELWSVVTGKPFKDIIQYNLFLCKEEELR